MACAEFREYVYIYIYVYLHIIYIYIYIYIDRYDTARPAWSWSDLVLTIPDLSSSSETCMCPKEDNFFINRGPSINPKFRV